MAVCTRTKGSVLETICHVPIKAHEQISVWSSNNALIGGRKSTVSPYVAANVPTVSSGGSRGRVFVHNGDILG